MLAVCREAVERGADAMTLEVRFSNRGAQGLYRQFGFRPVGVRKGYYQETGEDALVMWAHDVNEQRYADLLDAIERQSYGTTSPEEASS